MMLFVLDGFPNPGAAAAESDDAATPLPTRSDTATLFLVGDRSSRDATEAALENLFMPGDANAGGGVRLPWRPC